MALIWALHEYDEVDSTNKIVKQAISDGMGAGFAVSAKVQTNGYGMRGHKWISPAGGLYMSCLLDCNLSHEELPKLPRKLAESVLPALNSYSKEELTIKEPNDIVIKKGTGLNFIKKGTGLFFHKLAGISTEVYKGKVCVGIGVNIFAPEQGKQKRPVHNLKNKIVYLSDIASREISIEIIRDEILDAWSDKLEI